VAQLRAEERDVTVRNVRLHLGRASNTTLIKFRERLENEARSTREREALEALTGQLPKELASLRAAVLERHERLMSTVAVAHQQELAQAKGLITKLKEECHELRVALAIAQGELFGEQERAQSLEARFESARNALANAESLLARWSGRPLISRTRADELASQGRRVQKLATVRKSRGR
jgi:chromosome segregation ATPase